MLAKISKIIFVAVIFIGIPVVMVGCQANVLLTGAVGALNLHIGTELVGKAVEGTASTTGGSKAIVPSDSLTIALVDHASGHIIKQYQKNLTVNGDSIEVALTDVPRVENFDLDIQLLNGATVVARNKVVLPTASANRITAVLVPTATPGAFPASVDTPDVFCVSVGAQVIYSYYQDTITTKLHGTVTPVVTVTVYDADGNIISVKRSSDPGGIIVGMSGGNSGAIFYLKVTANVPCVITFRPEAIA